MREPITAHVAQNARTCLGTGTVSKIVLGARLRPGAQAGAGSWAASRWQRQSTATSAFKVVQTVSMST